MADDYIWAAKIRRHRHNSFRGHCAMMRSQCRSIINSDSTTEDAKSIASSIEDLARLLDDALLTRIDPK
jgi:hypothetical protein